MTSSIPALGGVLSAAEISRTASSIAAMQEPDGAIPWTSGQHADAWNHVEAAMALLVGGQPESAERAYEWCLATQRADGSWPMKTVLGHVVDDSGESNMSAYLAVGVWHHWLVRRDADFVGRYWDAVRRGLDFVVGLQLPFGGIAWAQAWTDNRPANVLEEALIAGSSSIYQALRAGVALSELVGDPQPQWELAGGRLGHALREHRELFLDKSRFSMDWYYPVLGGAVRGELGHELIESLWETFVISGLGIRCVTPNEWVTGAETAELAMALDNLGERARATKLLADMQHLRDTDGSYWTGYVVPDNALWPTEHTTFTAAAVVLAVDALSHTTGGSDIMRGASMGSHFPDIRGFGLQCGCVSGDRIAGHA